MFIYVSEIHLLRNSNRRNCEDAGVIDLGMLSYRNLIKFVVKPKVRKERLQASAVDGRISYLVMHVTLRSHGEDRLCNRGKK